MRMRDNLWNSTCTVGADTVRAADRYSLDSLSRPANHAAPERDKDVWSEFFSSSITKYCSTGSCCVSVTYVLSPCGSVTQHQEWRACWSVPYTWLWIVNKDEVQRNVRYYQHNFTYLQMHRGANWALHRRKQRQQQALPYFLIGVARRDGEHVGLVSENFSPVPLTGLHTVLKVVLVVGVEGLDAATETRIVNTSTCMTLNVFRQRNSTWLTSKIRVSVLLQMDPWVPTINKRRWILNRRSLKEINQLI